MDTSIDARKTISLLTFFCAICFASKLKAESPFYYGRNGEKIEVNLLYGQMLMFVDGSVSSKTFVKDLQNLPSFAGVTQDTIQYLEYVQSQKSHSRLLLPLKAHNLETYSLALKEIQTLGYAWHIGITVSFANDEAPWACFISTNLDTF